MDEYLILLLFLGILFVLFFYREEIFGQRSAQIIQPLQSRNKKSHKKNKKRKKVETESESESEESKESEESERSESRGNNSDGSHETFPSIGSKLSHGDNDTFG